MNKVVQRWLLTWILLLAPFFFLPWVAKDGNVMPYLTSFAIMTISALALVGDRRRPFSIKCGLFIFIYIFFGVVPIFTFYKSIVYWDADPFSSYDYILTNIIVLIFVTTYLATEYILLSFSSSLAHKIKLPTINCTHFSVSKSGALVFLSLVISFYVFYKNGFDVLNVWTRGKFGDPSVLQERSQIQWLIESFFIVPILAVNCVLINLTSAKGKGVHIFLLVLLIISAPPTSMARFSSGVIYIALLLGTAKMRKYQTYPALIFSSIFFILPFLDLFRKPEIWVTNDFSITSIWLRMFYEGHFDAYQSLMLVVKHDLITYGYQILGPLLFFVPRSLWVGKPIGSGEYLSNTINLSFHNISASYLTEGYINFGLPGVIMFSILLSIFVTRIDGSFWFQRQAGVDIFYSVRYYFLVPFIFFIMRGDLLSSFAYLVGMLCAVEFVKLYLRLVG
jgi:hypothetical protein